MSLTVVGNRFLLYYISLILDISGINETNSSRDWCPDSLYFLLMHTSYFKPTIC